MYNFSINSIKINQIFNFIWFIIKNIINFIMFIAQLKFVLFNERNERQLKIVFKLFAAAQHSKERMTEYVGYGYGT